jgi:hypothetical protein
MHFQSSGPALTLSYQTDLKLDETESLRHEVSEIWRDFQKEADSAKVTSAVIMASEIPRGRFVAVSRSQNFVFIRSPDGSWPSEPLTRTSAH